MDLFFVPWVFVIENLNKGYMNIEMCCILYYIVFKDECLKQMK